MTTIDAVLLDLDDTLLGNDMDEFLKSYFALLGAYAAPVIESDKFLPELMYATRAMIDSDDHDLTNREVFWRVFCQRNGLQQVELEPFFARFYRERFGELESTTQRRPEAVEAVRWCLDNGLQVVVATNPLFPMDAIEQRLAWAGVPVDEFDYALVTGYENMHSAKPRSAYYREILSTIGIEADRALMVGDDWQNDIVPAGRLGLYTYWIAPEGVPAPDNDIVPDGQGQLADLIQKLEGGWPKH